MDKTPLLGILTWRKGTYVEEKTFFTDLAKEAKKNGLHMIVFAPEDILKIQADQRHPFPCLRYDFEKKIWKISKSTMPDIIYDRFRHVGSPSFKTFVQVRKRIKVPFLNSRFAHKWHIHKYLSAHPEIRGWLPTTQLYRGMNTLFDMMKNSATVYLKPVNGTGGREILKITKQGSFFTVGGRTKERRIIASKKMIPHQLVSFVKSWTSGKKFIVQQGLDIQFIPHTVSDFRLLVQKNGSGEWEITGMGAKLGKSSSVTSNLHGGGMALSASRYLARFFSEEKVGQLLDESKKIGLIAAPYLEKRFGRLTEMGIDLGIDREGNIWIIEINTKPGRDIFKKMGEVELYQTAVKRPIDYALYLIKNFK